MCQCAIPSATSRLDVGVQQMTAHVLLVYRLTTRADVSTTALLLPLEQSRMSHSCTEGLTSHSLFSSLIYHNYTSQKCLPCHPECAAGCDGPVRLHFVFISFLSLSICLFIHAPICLFVCCPFIHLCVCLCVCAHSIRE